MCCAVLCYAVLCCAVMYRDFELAVKTSHLAGVLENVFCGSSEGGVSESRDAVCRYVHDQVHSGTGISTPEVLVLAFHVLQVATRALARGAIQCMKVKREAAAAAEARTRQASSPAPFDELVVSPMKGSNSADASITIAIGAGAAAANKRGRFFVPQTVLSALPFPTDQLLIQVLQTSGRAVIADTCLRVRDICMAILWRVEDTVVIRRCLGIMTEVG
jgi:hypothetical protein